MRVSNFLLWQIAYAEIWVTDALWPDFRARHLLEAIVDYQKRDRRYGAIALASRSAPERMVRRSIASRDRQRASSSSPSLWRRRSGTCRGGPRSSLAALAAAIAGRELAGLAPRRRRDGAGRCSRPSSAAAGARRRARSTVDPDDATADAARRCSLASMVAAGLLTLASGAARPAPPSPRPP